MCCRRWKCPKPSSRYALGGSRLSVSELLREKCRLSAEMATRLALLLDTTPESWLRMQEAIDLWAVRQTSDRFKDIKPIEEGRLGVWGNYGASRFIYVANRDIKCIVIVTTRGHEILPEEI
jgi:hypothetical protein